MSNLWQELQYEFCRLVDEYRRYFWWILLGVVIMFAIFSLVILLSNVPVVFAEEIKIDIGIIIHLESSRNPNAMGSVGEIGLMQISSVVLKEWNNRWEGTGCFGDCISPIHKDKIYNLGDLYYPSINIEIGTWYINKRIPQMLRYYSFEDTIENRIRAYNWGIGKMVKFQDNLERMTPNTTINYINKYKRLKENCGF